MAMGQIPYTRGFTVIPNSNQDGGASAAVEMLSPASAATEIAASAAEGRPVVEAKHYMRKSPTKRTNTGPKNKSTKKEAF